MKASPAPAGAGTPVLKPADLCGCSAASIRALNRARRSAQQTASASAAIQPNFGACLQRPQEQDQRRRGAERDIVATANSSSAPNLLCARSSRAMRPSIPSRTPARTIAAERLLPLAADREADAGQPHAQRQRGDRIGDHRPERDPPRTPRLRSLADARQRRVDADFGEHRLAGDRALAEQHLAARCRRADRRRPGCRSGSGRCAGRHRPRRLRGRRRGSAAPPARRSG